MIVLAKTDKKHRRLVLLPIMIFLIAIGVFFGDKADRTVYSLTDPDGDSIFYYDIYEGQAVITGYEGSETNLEIPSGIDQDGIVYPVTGISEGAFFEQAGIQSVYIPETVDEIGVGAFAGSSDLTDIEVSPDNPEYWSIDGVLYDGTLGVLCQYPAGRAGFFPMPNTVMAVESYAFYGCTNLTGLYMSSEILAVGEEAFAGCTGLTEVQFEGIETIETAAFSGCTNLQRAYFRGIGEETVEPVMGQDVFSGCAEDFSIFYYNYMTFSSPFYGYPCMYKLPENHTGVDSGFSFTVKNGMAEITGYEGTLGEVSIPLTVSDGAHTYAVAWVKSLQGSQSYNWDKITKINIPYTVRGFATNVDAGNGLEAYDVNLLNMSYSSIDGVLFDASEEVLLHYPNQKAGSYIVPDGVLKIGNSSFSNCSKITSVTLPESVQYIGSGAFSYSWSLTEVNLAEGLVAIDRFAFTGTSMKQIAIPGSVEEIGEFAFHNNGLEDITVSEDNLYFCSIDGILYNGDLTNLILCPEEKAGTVQIPDTVEVIETAAFLNCRGIREITLPEGLASIEYLGLSNTGIDSIIIPQSVSYIGLCAFQMCENLESVYFLGDAPTVGEAIFDMSEPAVYYLDGNAGFSNPWCGMPAYPFTYADVLDVSFDSQGGSAIPSIDTGFNTTITLPTPPTKAYYTFAGWYKEQACTNVWDFDKQRVTATTTLYAKWTKNVYTIKYNGNGATWGSMANLAMTYDVAKNLTANKFTKDGYLFLGWATSPSGEVVYKDKVSVNNLTATNGATINLYAKWAAPITSATSYNYNSIKISWAAACNATSYRIYRATSASGTYSLVKIADSTARSYVNTGLVTGKTYYYKVSVVASGKAYHHSAYKSAKAIPATPTIALSKYSSTAIKVSWSGVSGATKYQIFRATSATGTYTYQYTASSTARSWVNTGLTRGKTYYYKVRAYHLEGTTKVYGATSAVKYLKL